MSVSHCWYCNDDGSGDDDDGDDHHNCILLILSYDYGIISSLSLLLVLL